MLDTLISSKTRLKLLVRLFLNPASMAHLRGLAEEFEESTNAVRLELNRFEDAGMIVSQTVGNKKLYQANSAHPLFRDLNNILLKYVGLDKIVENVISKIGHLSYVYLTGDYARGNDSGIIDLIFIGNINSDYLGSLLGKAEPVVSKKIRYLIYSDEDWSRKENNEVHAGNILLLWSAA